MESTDLSVLNFSILDSLSFEMVHRHVCGDHMFLSICGVHELKPEELAARGGVLRHFSTSGKTASEFRPRLSAGARNAIPNPFQHPARRIDDPIQPAEKESPGTSPRL
jgi:hypothetical protein